MTSRSQKLEIVVQMKPRSIKPKNAPITPKTTRESLAAEARRDTLHQVERRGGLIGGIEFRAFDAWASVGAGLVRTGEPVRWNLRQPVGVRATSE